MKRIRIKETDPNYIARRLAALGCTPIQIQKHINALTRPKPKKQEKRDPHRPESSIYDGWCSGVAR
jgi:hypothetical protein